MDEAEILEKIDKHKFYHVIQLTEHIATPGVSVVIPAQELCMKHLKTIDFKGKRVLDIGCRDGLFSFAAESMGASEVIGIDNDLSTAATEFLIPFFDSEVRMEEMNLYDLSPETFGLFDVIIFPGVLYHLRYPFWALKVMRDLLQVGGHLLIETATWEAEKNNAMLFCPTGDESPYEPTSCTYFNEKGLRDTLESIGFESVAFENLVKASDLQQTQGFVGKLRSKLKLRSRLNSLFDQHRPPIKTVNRSVLHCIFRGESEDSFVKNYWESGHDFHTKKNGASF